MLKDWKQHLLYIPDFITLTSRL